MFNTQKDQLFTLIKSLSKSEKRNFKLYVNRLQKSGDAKFLQLFETIDKLEAYNEASILKKNPGIQKRNLPNLKRHLYKQILTSLRLIYINKQIDIEIREQLDFARILYGKGMYMQSLKILERIKKIAVDHHQDILHLEILEFQKMIETRHVTRSRQAGKIDDLLKDATRRSWVTYAASLFSNLNIQIHGWYIENGHALTTTQRKEARAFYHHHLPEGVGDDRMTFHEKINFYQANMWLYYILLDLKKSQENALAWINQFETEQILKQKDPDLFMRGYYYLLTLLFMLREESEMEYYLEKFSSYIRSQTDLFNENSQMIAFVYQQLAQLNLLFLQRDYQSISDSEEEILQQVHRFIDLLDPHRAILFYYKLAYAQFGLKNYDACLLRLNKIVHLSDSVLRSDVMYAARLLQIICHLELDNYDVAEHLVTSCKRSFAHRKDVSNLTDQLLMLFGKISRSPKDAHERLYQAFWKENQIQLESKNELRTTLFFNTEEFFSQKIDVSKTRERPDVGLEI